MYISSSGFIFCFCFFLFYSSTCLFFFFCILLINVFWITDDFPRSMNVVQKAQNHWNDQTSIFNLFMRLSARKSIPFNSIRNWGRRWGGQLFAEVATTICCHLKKKFYSFTTRSKRFKRPVSKRYRYQNHCRTTSCSKKTALNICLQKCPKHIFSNTAIT